MIVTFLLIAALQDAPKQPKFGAFVETLPTKGSLECVAFDADGRVLMPPESIEFLRARSLARHSDGRIFATVFAQDRIRPAGASGEKLEPFGERGQELGQLRRPGGLAIDARGAGRLLVADTLNHRVAVFDLSGKPLACFGRLGSGDGELNHPLDVAVDARGNAFVADAGNDRIVTFDAQGKFVKSFGGTGSYPGLFRNPTGLDIHGDRVYVADRDNHRIQVFDPSGQFDYEWGVSALQPREGAGKLHDPSDVAVSPDGQRVAVIEPAEDRIQIFGPAREDTLMTSPLGDTGVHFGGFPSVRRDVLAVANPIGPYVSIFDLTIGTPVEITKIGRPGRGPGRMVRPTSVLLDEKAERVYVADRYAYTISSYAIARKADEPLRFDPLLARFERSIDLTDRARYHANWVTEPGGMIWSADGDLLVADEANQRVLALDRELNVRMDACVPWLLGPPIGIARSPVSKLLAFTQDQAMQSLLAVPIAGAGGDPADGNWIMTNGSRTYGVALNSKGMFWCTQSALPGTDDHNLLSGSAGDWLNGPGHVRGPTGVGRGEFWKPEGIAIDEQDRMFVVDAGNHRFQILDAQGEYVDMFGARFYTEAARNPAPVAREAKPWDGARPVRTRDASWRVAWKPRARIERGTPCAIDAWVFRPGFADEPVRVVELRLDAYMPEHLHGMNRIPTVTRREDGGFTIEGVLLHMSGFWELDFDVTAKGVTERATTRVDLE